GVRPALHINLSSYEVAYAGEVDSKGRETASESTDKISADKIREPRIKNGVTTWDCVYFGSYSQNCTFEKQQDIEWRVLSVNGDDAFLLADKVLDVKPYNEKMEDVTWETCSLRKWLNNNFYNEAFNDEEKKAVIETMVFNQSNNDVEGGKDTKDKVYLLSIAEAEHADYGFDTKFGSNSETREAKGTDYAKVNNVSGNKNGNGFGYWWLRSPGGYSNNASRVGDEGGGSSFGDVVSFSMNGVRPALHIDLSKKPEETQKPTASPEPTKKPGETEKPIASSEPTKKPGETDKPTVSSEPTKKPSPTASPEPTAPPEPTKKPSSTDKPISSTGPERTQTPVVTAQPAPPSAPPSVEKQNPVQTKASALKKLKLSSVKRAKNSKKITGKVSVAKTSIKIKVGRRAYKKAAVKGKKFTLKLKYKLKKKTKIKIKVKKKGYKSLVKS
ncbi:MAG: hypothetical protein K2K09_00055, partial [Lachnospiraceae bacterium]|nr:hypothetical protein [Lachnospiraceae bacterium]